MIKNFIILIIVITAIFAFSCGGNDDGNTGDWDDTCYDCITVCEGTADIAASECAAKCLVCQGYSDCFAWMDGHYDGMSNAMKNWDSIQCSPDNRT